VPRQTSQSCKSILHADLLATISWLIHGFSTRVGGNSRAYGGRSLNLGFTKHDSHRAVERNREAFLKQLDATVKGHTSPLVTTRQIHSDLIHCVDDQRDVQRNNEGNLRLVGDGLITRTRGILLAVLTADCLPIIVVDPRQRAVGVFHAGWRGTVKRIIEKGIGEMRRCFGSRPLDIRAAIGPGIHSCCYEVGPEVREQFESQFGYGSELFHEVKDSDPVREKYPLLFLTARAPGHSDLPRKIFLDLVEANRRQLLAAGVPAGNIFASPLCTSCRTDLLFSHRAEKGITGRMMAAVGIRPRDRD